MPSTTTGYTADIVISGHGNGIDWRILASEFVYYCVMDAAGPRLLHIPQNITSSIHHSATTS